MEHTNRHASSANASRKKMRDIAPRRSVPLQTSAEQSIHPDSYVERELEDERTIHRRTETRIIKRNNRIAGVFQSIASALALAAILVGAGYGATYQFGRVRVVVTPVATSVPIAHTTVVALASPSPNVLLFETASKETSKETMLQVTETAYQETFATGTVRIFNTYSTLPQALPPKTAFSAQGKTFYLKGEKVVVPGMKGKNPGTVDVVIVAAEPGKEYNLGNQDFTISAFANTKKASTIIARSLTPLAGGWKGDAPLVSDEAKGAMLRQIGEAVVEQAIVSIREQTPARFVLLRGGFVAEPPKVALEQTDSGYKATATISGTHILFDEATLTHYLASRFLPGYDPNKEQLYANFDDIRIVPQATLPVGDHVQVTFSGSVTFYYKDAEDKIAQSLVGTSRFDLSSVFARWSHIARAEIRYRPFWMLRAPRSRDRIAVEYVPE